VALEQPRPDFLAEIRGQVKYRLFFFCFLKSSSFGLDVDAKTEDEFEFETIGQSTMILDWPVPEGRG